MKKLRPIFQRQGIEFSSNSFFCFYKKNIKYFIQYEDIKEYISETYCDILLLSNDIIILDSSYSQEFEELIKQKRIIRGQWYDVWWDIARYTYEKKTSVSELARSRLFSIGYSEQMIQKILKKYFFYFWYCEYIMMFDMEIWWMLNLHLFISKKKYHEIVDIYLYARNQYLTQSGQK